MTGNEQEEFRYLINQVGDISTPARGDLLEGVILSKTGSGYIIDLGLKRDGILPVEDLQKIPAEERSLTIGDRLTVMVVDPSDQEGNMIVSLAQACESHDWCKALELLESEGILECRPVRLNNGGVIVKFGRLDGFIPASHLRRIRWLKNMEGRDECLAGYIGRSIPVRVIEVDPQRRRLILSERKAMQQWRQQKKSRVIARLTEGEVCQGRVSSFCDFGAFINVGGADGLVHISEIAWHQVDDLASEMEIGQELDVKVIRLDPEMNRIELSIKRLQPNPWEQVAGRIETGQLKRGTIRKQTVNGWYVQCADSGLEGIAQNPGRVELSAGLEVLIRVVAFDLKREHLELEIISEQPDELFSGDNLKGREVITNDNGCPAP